MNQLWLIPNHEVFSNIFCFDHDTIQPDILLLWLIVLRTQSFTSLKADLLYISGVLLKHFLEGSIPWFGLKREDLYLLSLLICVNRSMLHNNGAIPSRKYSNKAPNKWRHSVFYVLREICHEISKWLSPNSWELTSKIVCRVLLANVWGTIKWANGIPSVSNSELLTKVKVSGGKYNKVNDA